MADSKYLGWMYGGKRCSKRDEQFAGWMYLIVGLLFVLVGLLGLFKLIG
jgi:hypothetical protein